MGAFLPFVNTALLPYLRGLRDRPGASLRQQVISEVVSAVDKVDVDTERNLLDILDRVDDIHLEAVDQTHLFTLSQAYEGLLQKMGEKNNDGGQFFTPREVIRAIVKAIDPKVGETVYDPGCGTGGFLAQAFEWMRAGLGSGATAEQLRILREDTFFGREKADLVYPIALANLVLHGIDHPHIWHGNTLTGQTTYDGLFTGAPTLFDVVLMNVVAAPGRPRSQHRYERRIDTLGKPATISWRGRVRARPTSSAGAADPAGEGQPHGRPA